MYVSVIDSDGKPVSDLVKHNFGMVMFDGIETVRLHSEWEVKSAASGQVVIEHGFYGPEIDRPLWKNEAVLPEARLFGLIIHRGADRGQTLFKLRVPEAIVGNFRRIRGGFVCKIRSRSR